VCGRNREEKKGKGERRDRACSMREEEGEKKGRKEEGVGEREIKWRGIQKVLERGEKRKRKGEKEGKWDTCPIVVGWEKME
jgi:hypothetical protein